jgi:conjugal transfer pilus assembly protein TraU
MKPSACTPRVCANHVADFSPDFSPDFLSGLSSGFSLRFLTRCMLALWMVLAGIGNASAQDSGSGSAANCHGAFMNPITDLCWSCLFPLSVGAADIVPGTGADTANPGSPLCYCDNPPRVGISIGFWEPVRLVDVTRTPFCMVGLGGLSLDPGLGSPRGAVSRHDATTRSSFYQVHWYANPILSWLQVLLDFPCLEQGVLDVAYLTELDPLWADDELAAILNPEAVLFANPAAQAACALDCMAATAGIAQANLFWCAGCQGSIYPMTGHVATHIGGVQASTLLVQRMTAKMHREFVTYDGAGEQGLCGYYAQPILDKTHYRLQMVYPVPATAPVAGQCCQPFGRTTMLWGAGKSFPVAGEDFSYQLFRKRNCCASTF